MADLWCAFCLPLPPLEKRKYSGRAETIFEGYALCFSHFHEHYETTRVPTKVK
jgi:hypothetical protein